MIDHGPLRPRRQIVFERFNSMLRSFSKRFDATIRTVAHVTDNLMPRGRALREKTITNSLHFSAYEKLARYSQANSPLLTCT